MVEHPNPATPRGIRNNNPGNIERRAGVRWRGMTTPQHDPRFLTFTAPEYGVRAIARTLLTYRRRHGLDTVRALIARWAPPGENDTDAYVRAAAGAAGVDPDRPIELERGECLGALVKAVIAHENGVQPYPEAVIRKGLAMAGVADTPAGTG